eukprot:COSAG02_NODE_2579_length_8493_cov_28.456040_7_plen_71_part_00
MRATLKVVTYVVLAALASMSFVKLAEMVEWSQYLDVPSTLLHNVKLKASMPPGDSLHLEIYPRLSRLNGN